MNFTTFLENNAEIDALRNRILAKYPSITLNLYENDQKIHLSNIIVPENMRSQGIGTDVIKQIQAYAQQIGKPIVLHPEPARGKKDALMRFYKSLGFVKNSGRKKDYALSSFFGTTMYWKPKK